MPRLGVLIIEILLCSHVTVAMQCTALVCLAKFGNNCNYLLSTEYNISNLFNLVCTCVIVYVYDCIAFWDNAFVCACGLLE